MSTLVGGSHIPGERQLDSHARLGSRIQLVTRAGYVDPPWATFDARIEGDPRFDDTDKALLRGIYSRLTQDD